MRGCYTWVALPLFILNWCASVEGQTGGLLRIPPVQGTSFTGQSVSLPRDLQGKVGVLVLGFTQSSRDSVKGWGVKLSTDYSGPDGLAYYEMPVLASVPRLLRGYVTGKIKESVSERARPHFVPITENEAAWRMVTGYKGGDDAYVVVVDESGVVRWQTHGAVSDDAFARLKVQIVGRNSAAGHASE